MSDRLQDWWDHLTGHNRELERRERMDTVTRMRNRSLAAALRTQDAIERNYMEGVAEIVRGRRKKNGVDN